MCDVVCHRIYGSDHHEQQHAVPMLLEVSPKGPCLLPEKEGHEHTDAHRRCVEGQSEHVKLFREDLAREAEHGSSAEGRGQGDGDASRAASDGPLPDRQHDTQCEQQQGGELWCGGDFLLDEHPHASRDDRDRGADDLVEGEGDVNQASIIQHDVHDLEEAHCCDSPALLLNCGAMEGAKGGQGHDRREDAESNGQVRHRQEDGESEVVDTQHPAVQHVQAGVETRNAMIVAASNSGFMLLDQGD